MNNHSNNVWETVTRWIFHHKGFVNPLLCYDEDRRQVLVKNTTCGDEIDCDTSAKSLKEEKHVINRGDILLLIPDKCILSLHSIENTDFGTALFSIVHSLLPKNHDQISHSKKATRNLHSEDKAEGGLYNDEQDVIMALFLAYLMENKGRELYTTEENDNVDKTKPWLFFQPYIDTFPINEFSDLLPRQWSLETIERRLIGTSLHHRVLLEKKGIVEEYNALKSSWETIDLKPSDAFPSFESYDIMMAAVTSRGFAGLGYEELDAMVPILDLLNHARGRMDDTVETACENERRISADVRYERSCNANHDNNGSPVFMDNRLNMSRKRRAPSKNVIEVSDGVKVTARSQLKPGMGLLMTYGAKGNASLLGRYGFCLENNVEPDGSCNDVLEIQLCSSAKPVRLIRGPKSYSYSSFMEAFSIFLKKPQISETYHTNGDKDKELHSFLDECDNESEEEYEDDEIDYNEPGDDSMLLTPPGDTSQINEEIAALTSLMISLIEVKTKLKTNKLACCNRKPLSTQDYYCSILIKSELETLSFFIAVCESLKRHLDKLLNQPTTSTPPGGNNSYNDSFDMAEKYTSGIVNTFFAIRYPTTL